MLLSFCWIDIVVALVVAAVVLVVVPLVNRVSAVAVAPVIHLKRLHCSVYLLVLLLLFVLLVLNMPILSRKTINSLMYAHYVENHGDSHIASDSDYYGLATSIF